MSDLIYQFSQQPQTLLTNIGQGAANLGGNIANLINQRRMAEAEAQKRAEYEGLLSTAMDTGTPDAWFAAIKAAPPQEVEQLTKAYETMGDIERQQKVQGNMEVIGALGSGNDEIAINKLTEMANAYSNAGEDGEAKVLSGFADQIKNGNGKQVMDFLTMTTGVLPEGQEAISTMFELQAGQRAEAASEESLLKTANSLDFSTPEDKARAMEVADGHNMETATRLIELASVRSKLGADDAMNSNEFFKAEQSLRKEYDTYVSGYNTMIDSAAQMENMLRQQTGASDQAMIMLFNKVLDPNSVVRESEARMTAGNQAAVDRARAYLASLSEGDRLSETGRKELFEAAKIMSGLAESRRASEKDRIMETVKTFNFSPDRIFLEEQATPEAAPIPTVSNVVPQAGGDGRLTALREHVKRNNPQSTADFDNMSEEQLNKYNAAKTFQYAEEEEEPIEVSY